MNKITKLFIVVAGLLMGIALAELSYYPAKRAIKKRHYITLRS